MGGASHTESEVIRTGSGHKAGIGEGRIFCDTLEFEIYPVAIEKSQKVLLGWWVGKTET